MPERVIVAVAALAVNLYHTPNVVVEVAPPQLPVGAAFAAFCKFPEEQFTGVKSTAVAQLACASKSIWKLKRINKIKNDRKDKMDFINRFWRIKGFEQTFSKHHIGS